MLERGFVGARDPSVEVLLPGEGRLLQAARAGGAQVLLVDPGRCPPYRDVAEDLEGELGTELARPRRRGVAAGAYPGGRVGHKVRSRGQVAAPRAVLAQRSGHGRQPRQRSGTGTTVTRGVQPPVKDGGRVHRAVQRTRGHRVLKVGDRVGALRGQQDQVSAQRGPRGLRAEARDDLVGALLQLRDSRDAQEVLCGEVQRIGVAGDHVAEQPCRVGVHPSLCGR